MVLATLLLVCSLPQMDDASKLAASSANAEQPAASVSTSSSTTKDSKDSTVATALPVAPEPKVKTDADPAALRPAAAQPFQPVKPALTRPYETPGQRKAWYALSIIGAGGATLDAWSTRRAISGGYGQEANPFLQPFAKSNVLYAATQVSPALLDFLGKRLMTNEHRWVRKVWWLPQTAGASFSFVAAAHNISVVH